jgi:GDP-L-fucose synthase
VCSIKILLTGGSGFIGKNILEKLSGKYEILAPSHRALDIVDQNSVDRFFYENRIDAIIHSAVKPGHRNASDLTGLLKTDLQMYFNLAKNAVEHNIKMFTLGSGCCYDMRSYRPEMKEEYMGVSIPVDDTGFAKYISALDAMKSGNIYDLRVFGIFGKYEDYEIRFISNAICKALYGLPITIRQNRKFDYLWIDDFIDIIDRMLGKNLTYHGYNITPDAHISLCDAAVMARNAAGRPELEIRVGSEGMGMEYTGCNTRLKSELEDVNFTPYQQSIKVLCEWYRERLDSIDKTLLLADK